MRSKSASLINKLEEERRQLRLEDGKRYAEQKRKFLLQQEKDRKLKEFQQKEEIKNKLFSLKETTRRLASLPTPETPLKKLLEIRNSFNEDIDRIITNDKVDNEALNFAIIGDEASIAVDKGFNELSETIELKKLYEIQHNIAAGLPPMTTKSKENDKKITIQRNIVANSKKGNTLNRINPSIVNVNVQKAEVIKKPSTITRKSTLTRRVAEPVSRVQKYSSHISKSSSARIDKKSNENDSSLLDMLETQNNDSFIHPSYLRDIETTQNLSYYNDKLKINQNMQSVVSEVTRLSHMLDDLNREIEEKVASDTIMNQDNYEKIETSPTSKSGEKIMKSYSVETFDDNVNYCDDDDEVHRKSFDVSEFVVESKSELSSNFQEPESAMISNNIFMKSILGKLQKKINTDDKVEKYDGLKNIRKNEKSVEVQSRIDNNINDKDSDEFRSYPFRSTNIPKKATEQVFNEDVNLFPFPLYNDVRTNNAQYQRSETLFDSQARAELGYLQDRKLIVHDYGNDFVVEKILDTAAFTNDSIPHDSSYDHFSKNYIKNTLDSIDNEGKRKVEKITESDSDVKITNHIIPSGARPTINWSSTYGLLPSLRNVGELAGMICLDYDNNLSSFHDTVVTDDESFSEDEDHCIVNIAAVELAKKAANEKVKVQVATEKANFEEIDVKNESIAETSVDSEEEVDSPNENNRSINTFESPINDVTPTINIDNHNYNDVQTINIPETLSLIPEFVEVTSTSTSKSKVPTRLSPAELRQIMISELRKQDEILNYELELSELEQAHAIQAASNIVERFITSKELEAIESKKQQELMLHQQAYEMSLTTALLNAQINIHSETIARNEIIADLQSQMREQEINQDYANLISCTSQMVDIIQQSQTSSNGQEFKRDTRKSVEDYNHVAVSENVRPVQKTLSTASPIRNSQQNTSTSSSIIDEVPDIKFTPIKSSSNRNNVFSPVSDDYSDEFEEIEDEVSEDIIIETTKGYVSPREYIKHESREIKSPFSREINESAHQISNTPKTLKIEQKAQSEFLLLLKEFEIDVSQRKMVQEKKLNIQSQLLKSKRDKHLKRIQQLKQNANQSYLTELINEEKQVSEKYLEGNTVLEREKWSINANYYRDLRKLRQMQLDYDFCNGGTIAFTTNADHVNDSYSSKKSSFKGFQHEEVDDDEIEEEVDLLDRTEGKKDDFSLQESMQSLKLLSPKYAPDDGYDEDFEDYKEYASSTNADSQKLSTPKQLSPQKPLSSQKSSNVVEYQQNNFSKEIEVIEESINERQKRIQTIRQNIVGIESDEKQYEIMMKRKAENERLAAEEAKLYKNLNDKLNQISSSKKTASDSIEENSRLASNISAWVKSIREPFTKTIEMLQEDDSLDDSSWCSDTADVQISKLPMRLDIYIEKRVKSQFSALHIQKVVRGWLVRKRSYVSNDVIKSARDFNLLKFRGNLVHEHAAAVAVEDLALEDSFISDNESINYEEQFSTEQMHLQKQMAKVEELSNVLARREKTDFQINDTQLLSPQEVKKSPNFSPVKSPSIDEKDSISNSESPNLMKALSSKEVKNSGIKSKDTTSTLKSPNSSASSPDVSKSKSNERISNEVNSPLSINASPTREEYQFHEVKSPVMTSPLQQDDSYGDPEELSFDRSSEIQDSPSHPNVMSVDDDYIEDKEVVDILNSKRPSQTKVDIDEKVTASVDNNSKLKDSGAAVENSVEERLETSEVEDDFEIDEDDDNDKEDVKYIDNNINDKSKDQITDDCSDEEIEEDEIINDLSSPGKAIILDDDEEVDEIINDLSSPGKAIILDDDEEVQFETYSNDTSTFSESPGHYTSKSDENKKISLTSLSDMPPLKPSTTTKPNIDDTDFDELYDFDEKELNQVKAGTADIQVIDWVENVDSFISHLLVQFNIKNIIGKIDDKSFDDKFIPVELFDSIYATYQNEHNLIDHCRAVYDRVNDLLTELHTLRHASSIVNDSYSNILLAKNMIINENNIKNYIKEKLLTEQKKVYGILPEIKVDVLSEIESTLQSNLNKAADELTDIILARMLSDISQQLHYH